MAIIGFIPGTIAVVLLIAGLIVYFMKGRVSSAVGSIGSVVGLKKQMFGLILIALGLLAGAGGIVMSAVNIDTASIGGDEGPTLGVGTVGALEVTVEDGLANTTATEDYYNDEDTFLTFYSADANIADGEEYSWNISIVRDLVSEDASVEVRCSIPDKEISGVTADNLAEKTAGQVDLDLNDGGRHADDNTVYRNFAMTEGDNDLEITVAFDQEETYHDGMTDLDDYVDVVCDVTGDDGSSGSVTTRIYADS